MNTRTISTAAWLMSLVTAASVSAQTSGRDDGMRFLPDVRGQFKALTERPDVLGFHIAGSPDPSGCRHYQAVVRVDAADGTPYFLVTRSGNTPNVPGPNEIVCDDSDHDSRNGHLIVFRMGSRPKHGERLRSNRFPRSNQGVDAATPPPEDQAVNYFTVVGGDPGDPDPAGRPRLAPQDNVGSASARVYQHAGGMALVGHMLAIALEHPREFDAVPQTQIMFVDVSNPEAPAFTSQYAPINGASEVLAAAGVVAVTPLPGGRYLMIVSGGETNSVFYTYRSTLSDLSSPQLSWEYMGAIPGVSVEDAHQTLTFLRQGNIDGPLYLAGARGKIAHDRDRIDLYEVTCPQPDCDGGGVTVDETHALRGQQILPYPNSGTGAKQASLAAASAFHVTPSGELIFYATEHDNDGPNGTVKAGEWRHSEVVRSDSPTLLPAADVNGPYEVDEGGTVSLTGSAGPPVTRAFVQLFTEPDFGGFSLIGDIDDIDDIFLGFYPFVQSKSRSWNWYAPMDCSAFARNNLDTHMYRTLVGSGAIERDPDLRLVLNNRGTTDMDQTVNEIGFDTSCGQYYSQPFVLRWDLDGDGIFESTGSPVSFHPLEGPAEVTVPALAQDASNGPAGTTSARVVVRNVPPQLSAFSVTDGAGHQLNAQVPFALTNLPVAAAAQFSDPGVLDHQTATISWGDATIDANPAFTTFDEAFGDGTGALSHTHRYTAAGSYQLALTVRDDDGDVDTESLAVRIVTPEQAVAEIVGFIDAAIAGASDNDVRKSLEKARQALAGSNGHSENGALQKIRAGQPAAATASLKQAILWLSRAQADVPGATALIGLLEQVIAALSA